MSDAFKPLIGLAAQGPLSVEDAERAFEFMMSGEATSGQIGGFLMALRARGETVDEIVAAAKVMRAHCRPVAAPENAMDIVGTGGDGKGTLNISTATAFVVAGAGVPVAKHGNRALSSKAGAADTLAELGVDIEAEPETVERAIDEAGMGFMMAPVFHAAMRHVGPTRQELGTRTIFNVLGPLTNPAGVRRQLVGVYDPKLCRPIVEALRALGSETAWVVHGKDGSDEVSISSATHFARYVDGKVVEGLISPATAKIRAHPESAVAGGTPAENAARIRALLDGEKSGFRDAVLLNAAVALSVAGYSSDLYYCADFAQRSIDSGAARRVLQTLRGITGP